MKLPAFILLFLYWVNIPAQWHSSFSDKQDSLTKYYVAPNKLPFEINSYLSDDDKVISEVFKTYLSHFDFYPVITFNESYRELKNAGFLMQLYFPVVEQIITAEKLPKELAFLPYAISLYNPLFVNKDNRVGAWGLQYIIARKYHLPVTGYIDRRKDIVASTRVAVCYLKDIYAKHHAWEPTVIEFFSSAAILEKAKRQARSEKINDYFKYLPLYVQHEYRQFFEAVYYFGNVSFSSYPVYQNTDTVQVKSKLSFAVAGKHLFVSDKFMHAHNPVYWRQIIPADSNHYFPLVLPENKVHLFRKKEQDLYRLQQIADSIKARKNKITKPPVPKNGEPVTYIVESGDNLGYIAQKFHVKISDIQAWNNIDGHLINIGQKLVIYTANPPGTQTNDTTGSNVKPKFSPAQPQTLPQKKQQATNGKKIIYTVKSGDSLWLIARKFKVSVNQIMEWNNKKTERLDIGDQLIIFKPQ